jgi:hypothetical protein
MKKALLLLMLVVAGVFVGVFMSSAPQPAWRPDARLHFLGFTNTAPGAPATNAWFGLTGLSVSPISWEVLEIAHQQDGRWKQWKPLPVHRPNFHGPPPHHFIGSVSVPVPATNVPLRVVMEIGKNGIYPKPKGAAALYAQGRYRFRQWLYPDNPVRWNRGRAPLCCITNEFNFASGGN